MISTPKRSFKVKGTVVNWAMMNNFVCVGTLGLGVSVKTPQAIFTFMTLT